MGSLQIPVVSRSSSLHYGRESSTHSRLLPYLNSYFENTASTSSVYTDAQPDPLRRQRSDTFVETHRQSSRRSKLDDKRITPSELYLTAHQARSPPVRSLSTPFMLDLESESDDEDESPGHSPAADNSSSKTGAIIGNVLIRRAVRHSHQVPQAADAAPSRNEVTTQLEKIKTERQYWTPPPIESDQFDGGNGLQSPSTPVSPNDLSKQYHKIFSPVRDKFAQKKSSANSNSEQKSHLFSIGKRHNRYEQNLLFTENQLVYPPPPVSFDDNPETDRYGFKKASQWISVSEHREFELMYQPTLERRLLKWQQLLQENNSKLPERSPKVKRYIRKGVPAHLRGRVWLHYSGAEAKMEANPSVYDKFLEKAEELGDDNEFADIIARDLHRTFPDNIQFRTKENKRPEIIGALERVLSAFSVYCPSVGYCQSLNYIVGMLLLFMKEEEAFWTLVTIVQNILPAGVYDVTMEGSNLDQTVLMMLLSERMPQLWNKLSEKPFWDSAADGASMPTITLVTNHWFLTLFINILPIESVLRVWDCFFYEGSNVLFRIALTLFKMSENTVLSIDDSLEIFQVIQNMPKRIINCQLLMESAFRRYNAYTETTNDELERRREMCRERRKSGYIPTPSKTRTMPRRPFVFDSAAWKRKPLAKASQTSNVKP